MKKKKMSISPQHSANPRILPPTISVGGVPSPRRPLSVYCHSFLAGNPVVVISHNARV